MRSTCFAILLIAVIPVQAAVVTFEDIAPTQPCGGGCLDSITTAEGFVFSHTGASSVFWEVYVTEGGPDGNYLNTLFHPEYGVSMRVSHESGQAFDMHSLDTVVPIGPGGVEFDSVFVSGYDEANNLVVSKEFMPLPAGWNTILFDDSWNSVYAIEIAEYDFCTFGCASIPNSIDNFSANVVPIPAAAWLFCSALAGLGFVSRRIKAS